MSGRMIGVAALRDRLRSISFEFPTKVERALYMEGQIEMTESKRRVPVDTGALRASGFVEQPVRNGRNISVTLAYGTEYAIPVHENLEAHHRSPGQAKYLESVLNESRSSMAARLAARIRLDKKD